MAAKKQQKNAQQNIRLPLIGSNTNRSSSTVKDQHFINIFPETRKVEAIESTKIFMNKRPGLTLYKDFGTGEGRGVMWFRNKFYVAIGNKIIEDGTTPTDVITLSNSTGPLGMIVGNSSTLGDYLFVCDGIAGWVIKSDGTVIPIVSDAIRHVTITAAGSGYTNGTYNLTFSGGGGGTGAAGTYTVTDGIVTSTSITNEGSGYTVEPTVAFNFGGGTGASALVTLNIFPSPHIPTPTFIDGYIVLAQRSDVYTSDLDEPQHWTSSNFLTAEMFPDAVVGLARQNNQVVVFGENSTEFFYDAANVNGSPLARNDSTTLQMGNAAPYAVYQNEGTFLFVGQSESGGRAVWQVSGFQPKKVSDEFIERILDAEVDMLDCHGFGFRTKGHLFYLLNLPTINKTLLYDTEEKLWHEWSTNVGGSHTYFAHNYMVDNHTGSAYVLHISNGCLYKLDTEAYTDEGTTILVELQTNKYDMDTYKRKFMTNFRLVGDRYESANSIDVQWTDSDYETWSNVKTIALTDDWPNFARGGAFRRRAFRFLHALNKPLRLESLEITYYEGDS
jgi:hypothetical protein